MQRQRGELAPIGEVVTGLDDELVPAIRNDSPQARHHFTQADQVKSLAAQQASDLNGYIEYSSRTTEHLDSFSEYANVLAEKYNEMIRLMEERWL